MASCETKIIDFSKILSWYMHSLIRNLLLKNLQILLSFTKYEKIWATTFSSTGDQLASGLATGCLGYNQSVCSADSSLILSNALAL
jgi:hypothetical protein